MIIYLVVSVVSVIFAIVTIVIIGLCRDAKIPDIIKSRYEISYKTGDIISVSFPKVRGIFVSCITGCRWTHTGVIWCNINGVFVIEMIAKRKRNGLHITPIQKWLRRYIDKRGYNVGIRQYTGTTEITCGDLVPFLNATTDLFVAKWYTALYHIDYYKSDYKNKYFCSEMLGRLLQDVGILEKVYHSCCYSPKKLMEDELDSAYSYESAFLIN